MLEIAPLVEKGGSTQPFRRMQSPFAVFDRAQKRAARFSGLSDFPRSAAGRVTPVLR
jgi:hypothetical protein